MRRRSKARSNLAKAQRRKAEMPRRRAAPRLARERDEYPRRDELRPIMETALDAVIVMKSDGVVADWNDRAVGVFGWSRDEAVGRIMADLIIPERYREAHIPGALNIPAERIKELAPQLLPNKDAEIVTYCSNNH